MSRCILKSKIRNSNSSLKQSSQRELSVVTEKAKNDLNQKQNEINKITESLTKSEKVNDSLKKEIEKRDNALNEHKDEVTHLKKQIESLKQLN